MNTKVKTKTPKVRSLKTSAPKTPIPKAAVPKKKVPKAKVPKNKAPKPRAPKARAEKENVQKAPAPKVKRSEVNSQKKEAAPKRRKDGRLTKAERTKLAILQSAEVVFSEQGYERTTLDAVGEPVNVLGTAVLYHFKSKQFLYHETLRFAHMPLSKAITNDIDQSGTLEEMVTKIAVNLIGHCVERPNALKLFMREAAAATPGTNTIIGPMVGKALQTLFDAAEAQASPGKGSREIDPVLIFSMLIGVIGFYFSGFPTIMGKKLPYDPLDPKQLKGLEDTLVDLIKHMIRGT